MRAICKAYKEFSQIFALMIGVLPAELLSELSPDVRAFIAELEKSSLENSQDKDQQ